MTAREVRTPRAHHLPPAGAAVVAVAVLVAAAHVGGDALRAGAVLLVQLALVAAWVVATGAGAATAVLGVAASAGSVAALQVPDRPQLGGLLAVLGPAFLAAVLEQMLRRSRPDRVAALAAGVLLVTAVSALAVLLLVTGPGGLGASALLVVGAALVVGHLVDLVLPRPGLAEGVPRGLAGLVLAVLAGAAVGVARRGSGLGGAADGAVFGAVLAAVAALVAVVASYVAVETAAAGGRRVPALAVVQGLLPIAACAPVALALQAAL